MHSSIEYVQALTETISFYTPLITIALAAVASGSPRHITYLGCRNYNHSVEVID